MSLWLALIIFFCAVVVHEFGHYLMFVLLGYARPKLRFTWFAIFIGENHSNTIEALDLHAVALGGIVAGLLVILPFWNYHHLGIIYVIASAFDIIAIGLAMKVKRMYGAHVPISQYYLDKYLYEIDQLLEGRLKK